MLKSATAHLFLLESSNDHIAKTHMTSDSPNCPTCLFSIKLYDLIQAVTVALNGLKSVCPLASLHKHNAPCRKSNLSHHTCEEKYRSVIAHQTEKERVSVKKREKQTKNGTNTY
ncbi:hypothetical protein TNCV_3205931 [Trichonephila clavipes]|nr:hypothetical protein TNCV_3205931 [Trichonephila clavipes]